MESHMRPHPNRGATIPVPSPTTPFWRSQRHHLDNHRSTPDLPKEQDIVIVGAGFSGASCAYYISQHMQSATLPPRTTCTILEARDACSGATGRNGGHLRPDSLATFQRYAPLYGVKSASDIAHFELDNCKAVRDIIRAEEIACDYMEVVSSSVFLDDSQAEEAKRLLDELVAEGHDILQKFKYYQGQQAEEVSGVNGAKGLTTFEAACLWPYKLVMHLLAIVTSKGVNLQTNTPVLATSNEPDVNGYWTLSTPRGAIRAKKIIFATNGYTSHLLPQYSSAIVPVRGICSHIISHADTPPVSKTIMTMGIKHGPGQHDYLITRPDRSIIVGGAWKAVRRGPREDWHNVTDDSRLIPIAETYYNGFMNRTFKSWERTKADVDHLWTGIMGYTSDEVPHVGQIHEKPGQYLCAGFNGHGMPQVLLCARATVKIALEGCSFAETGVPSVFKTSVERTTVANK